MKKNSIAISNLDKKSKLLNVKAFAKFFVNNFLIGKFDSNFKGNGIDFHELREYIRGDDFRNIYWKASTNNKIYVKNYTETKENSFIIVIGNHRSLNFGTSNFKKKDGFLRSIELSKEYNLYRQDYCGCEFSFRK